VHAVVWSDYLCPWCYLGTDRTMLMRELGVAVTVLPFELHPEVPLEGRAVRPDGRLARVFAAIAAECASVGLPFEPPSRVPNSRLALEIAAIVRTIAPDSFDALDASLFRAVFVDGVNIADHHALDGLVAAAGAPIDTVHAELRAGTGRTAVDTSRDAAYEHGVAATPAWLVNDTLLIPGVQPRDTITRWIGRLRERAAVEPT
jgi:predicted DsbA family dithiol-disulfide isomerase